MNENEFHVVPVPGPRMIKNKPKKERMRGGGVADTNRQWTETRSWCDKIITSSSSSARFIASTSSHRSSLHESSPSSQSSSPSSSPPMKKREVGWWGADAHGKVGAHAYSSESSLNPAVDTDDAIMLFSPSLPLSSSSDDVPSEITFSSSGWCRLRSRCPARTCTSYIHSVFPIVHSGIPTKQRSMCAQYGSRSALRSPRRG
ncbi:hypothetical protein K438DRAFT_922926 [Mycena galopus ATCC 62051]|nr:hypothetical protein K438DRAFT_922926 [Mycena galopus ATCC 62051]